jgi:hypothetical protein
LGGVVAVSTVALVIPQLRATSTSGVNVPTRLAFVAQLYATTFSGDELYSWMFPTPVSSWPVALVVTLVSVMAIVGAATVAAWRTRRGLDAWTVPHRITCWYVVLFSSLVVQIVLTNKANGPHHLMMLFPFQDFLAFAAVGCVCRAAMGPFRPIARSGEHVAVALLVAILCATEASADARYARAFAAGAFQPAWSPAIYDLAADVDQQDADLVVSVDWGLNNQLLALARPEHRARYVDLWEQFARTSPDRQAIIAQSVRGRRVLFVGHPAAVELMPGTHAHLLAFLSSVRATG